METWFKRSFFHSFFLHYYPTQGGIFRQIFCKNNYKFLGCAHYPKIFAKLSIMSISDIFPTLPCLPSS